jgi:DNA-binding MarR family transcriptional regulator
MRRDPALGFLQEEVRLAKRKLAGAPRPLFLINRIRDVMNSHVAGKYREVNLTVALGEVLLAIVLEGQSSSSALARRLAITPQSIKQSVHSLERLKYVRRTRSATDQRVQTIEITRQGRLALDVCLRALDEMYDEIFGVLKSGELKLLIELLTKVVRATEPEALERYRDRRKLFPRGAADAP